VEQEQFYKCQQKKQKQKQNKNHSHEAVTIWNQEKHLIDSRNNFRLAVNIYYLTVLHNPEFCCCIIYGFCMLLSKKKSLSAIIKHIVHKIVGRSQECW